MSVVRPFAALRYAREPEPRLAPPWDVIAPDERERLAAQPENVVQLTLPPGPEGARDYASAARTFERWLRDGVLAREPRPAFFAVEQRVEPGRVRRGLFAALRLADYAERIVFPHERTLPRAKEDRLLLTRALRANLEPLFFVYEDRDAKLAALIEAAARGPALADCRAPDGTRVRMSRLDDPDAMRAVESFFGGRPVVIADGHHRYETMLRYRDERRAQARAAGRSADPEAPWEYVLAYLANAFDPGTQIRAIHRRLTGPVRDPRPALAARGFALEELPADSSAGSLLARLDSLRDSDHAFALVPARGSPLLARRARGAELDVRVLHDELLPALGGELAFDADPERLLRAVRTGEVALAILLNALPPERLFAEVQRGAILPQKSTYFAPKVPSGLVLREL